MSFRRIVPSSPAPVAPALAGCTTRPLDAPLEEADRKAGYRYESRVDRPEDDPSTVVEPVFPNGGTRAAATGFLRSSDECRWMLQDVAGKPAPRGGTPG